MKVIVMKGVEVPLDCYAESAEAVGLRLFITEAVVTDQGHPVMLNEVEPRLVFPKEIWFSPSAIIPQMPHFYVPAGDVQRAL
jgi:hypothetical protein